MAATIMLKRWLKLFKNMRFKNFSVFEFQKNLCVKNEQPVLYIQGQSPEPRIREYFYYIDHQGMLFLDDSKMKNFTSCFKEKQFLEFFFKRIRINDTGRYEKYFPFISPCGRERNYIRCDDLPIVYTHLTEKLDGKQYLSYGHAGDLLLRLFEPSKLCMLQESGRVYHPADDRVGGVGLVKSSLAIELSKYFLFEEGSDQMPTHFIWKEQKYKLTNELIEILRNNIISR